MPNGNRIRVVGAAAGALIGSIGAYLSADWLAPSGSPLELVAFLGVAGALLGLVFAMNVELYRAKER